MDKSGVAGTNRFSQITFMQVAFIRIIIKLHVNKSATGVAKCLIFLLSNGFWNKKAYGSTSFA